MQAIGIEDKKEDCIRYMARLSRPEVYDPNHPRFGMTAMGIRQLRGDLRQCLDRRPSCCTRRARSNTGIAPACPTTGPSLPEDKAPNGRVLVPKQARDTMSDGGVMASAPWAAAAKADGVDIRTGHRVQRVIVDDQRTRRRRRGRQRQAARRVAHQGAQGGDLRHRRLHARRRRCARISSARRCSAAARRCTNEGDFVHIGAAVGAELAT